MNLTQEALAYIEKVVRYKFKGNLTGAAKAFGVNYQTLYSWIGSRCNTPSLRSLEPVLDKLGVRLKFPNDIDCCDPSKDVCFVDAKMTNAADLERPEADDYIAAPLVGEVGAGPGYIPQDEVLSWVLVDKRMDSIRYRRNLLAVEIGAHSTSMVPTLHPKDIVLIDRDDKDVTHGKMFLVRDPDGQGMIKRVQLIPEQEDVKLVFYSDNAASYPPMFYSLKEDYIGDIDAAVVGRVIYAWTDMHNR